MGCWYLLKKNPNHSGFFSLHEEEKAKKSLEPVVLFNTILWKDTAALWHLSVQTPCFKLGKDLVLCVLPFEWGKTPQGEKKVLVLPISCINPLSLQSYHNHSDKIITNSALCFRKPRLVTNTPGPLDLKEGEMLQSKEGLMHCQRPPWECRIL